MEIQFMNQNDLDTLKMNADSNLDYYKSKDNFWMIDKLGHNPLVEYKRDVETFSLDPKSDEVDNARVIYSAMKNISDSEATDERLWAGLTHGLFWDFMRENIHSDIETSAKTKFTEKLIVNRYFFNIKENARKRSLSINSLSKLWWAGRLTYDKENKNDPYESLKLFRSAFSHKMINTFSSNYMANPDIRFAVFDVALELQQDGVEIKGDTMVPILVFLNEIGGKLLLDTYTRKEWRNELKRFAFENLDGILSR